MNSRQLEFLENILKKDDQKCKLQVIDRNVTKVKFKNQNFLFLCCYVNNQNKIKIREYYKLIAYFKKNFTNKYIVGLFLINENLNIISSLPLEKINNDNLIEIFDNQIENNNYDIKIHYDLNEIILHGYNLEINNKSLKSYPLSKLFHFKSEFLSFFLINNQKVKIKIKKNSFQYRNFDNIFFNKNFEKITNVISSLHNNDLSNISRKSDQHIIPNLPNIRKYIPQKEETNSILNIKNLDMDDIQNLRDRATSLHKKTLNILFKYLQNKKLDVYEDPKTFDMFAYNEKYGYLYEAKSISNKNLISQIRSAITQLSFYAFFHQKARSKGFDRTIKKYLIFHNNPMKYDKSNKLNLYLKFLNYLNIEYIWVEDGKIVNHV